MRRAGIEPAGRVTRQFYRLSQLHSGLPALEVVAGVGFEPTLEGYEPSD